jgi:hypothetical protein
LFDGVDDFITFSPGAAANIATGALSTVFLWRPNANHRGGLFDGRDGGSVRQIGANPFDNGDVFFAVNGSTSTGYAAYLNQWAVLGFTKPAGAGQTVRAHVYRFDTLAWTHTNLGAVSANAAIASIFVGSFDPTQFLNGNLAAIGLWTGTALSDANFEAGTGFQTTLANWFNLTPSVLWRFNQASVATPVTDLMSSGADQTAITGTTVSVDDPPGFSYNLTSTVDGTGVADLGALSAAASGGVSHPGVGVADLGALSAAVTGGVTVTGAALSDLGRLDAAAVEPDPDQFVSVLMDQLLACLCEQVALQPNPPQHCCFRVGTEIAHDAGILEDLCCEGLAYVALGDTYPSSDSFPEQDIVRQASAHCAPPTWAQAFKVGIIRCVPVGDQFLPPSCVEWNAASRQNVIDAQTLRRVACCMRNFVVNNDGIFFGMSLVIERQSQGNPQGGCVERSMTLTAQFPNLCDGC